MMPHYYIRQPDGRFAIFSSIIDDYIEKDLTREELLTHVLSNEHEITIREINHVCDYLEGKRDKTPRRNIMPFDIAEKYREIVHGNSAKKGGE